MIGRLLSRALVIRLLPESLEKFSLLALDKMKEAGRLLSANHNASFISIEELVDVLKIGQDKKAKIRQLETDMTKIVAMCVRASRFVVDSE